MKYAVNGWFDRSKISDELFWDREYLGNNYGNMLFTEAVHRSIGGEIVGSIFSKYAEKPDIYIYQSANMLVHICVKELAEMAQHVKWIDRPFIIAGIGCQGDLEYTNYGNSSESDKAAREYISTVLKYSKSIGVRGDFTKKYLMSIGIPEDRISVIGCPSLRYFGKNFDVSTKRYRQFNDKLKIAVNFGSLGFQYWDNVAMFLNKIFHYYSNSYAIMQEHCEAKLLMKGEAIADERYTYHLLPRFKEHFIIQQKRAMIFQRTDKWILGLKEFDFSIGTRLHGNIAAILSGIPALIIATDSRTREVAEYHSIPWISANEINDDTSLETLYYRACAGMNQFYADYPKKLKVYTDFLKYNGVELSEMLQ